jgi:DNA repair exonuclease SbcCD nuclease subunit
MRFVHSADWQIGKVFKQFGAKEETLRQARLAAIERLGELARINGVHHILVAGDVYDNEAPNTITLRAPIERMKPFADIQWHLLPGNHDPHRPEGVWDRVAQLGLPAHIHVHLMPTPVPLTDGAFLLPAPLHLQIGQTSENGFVPAKPGASVVLHCRRREGDRR